MRVLSTLEPEHFGFDPPAGTVEPRVPQSLDNQVGVGRAVFDEQHAKKRDRRCVCVDGPRHDASPIAGQPQEHQLAGLWNEAHEAGDSLCGRPAGTVCTNAQRDTRTTGGRRQSCRTTLSSELLILTGSSPSYSMKPSRLNLFRKKFTRERVVPIISASVSWEIFGTMRAGLSCLP